jgi:hypothetical protein
LPRLRRPLQTRHSWSRLTLEHLEDRLAPSVFYDFDVIAKTGDLNPALTGIDSSFGPSINDNGNVALVGQYSDGEGIVVGNGIPGSLRNINPNDSHLGFPFAFSDGVKINNNDQVVANDIVAGSPPQDSLRLYNADALNTFSPVATGGVAGAPWNAILPTQAVDQNGDVAYPAILTTDQFLAFYPAGSANNTHTSLAVYTNLSTIHPVMDNAGDVLVTQPDNSQITLYKRQGTGFIPIDIADSSTFASGLGQFPAISQDGTMVVFSGNKNATTLGPGLYGRVNMGSGFGPVFKIVGENQFFSQPPPELGYDVNPLTGDPIPIAFKDIDLNSQAIAVTHFAATSGKVSAGDSFQISFVGTPTQQSRVNPVTHVPLFFSANQGIWTIRENFDLPPSGTGALLMHQTSALPVVQVGDNLPSVMATVQSFVAGTAIGLGKKDQAGNNRVNWRDDHQVVFWANTTAGQMVIRGTHFDSSQDGLLDHWKTRGVDMNQDGTIDLNLAAMGARVGHRDLFLQMDWLAPRGSGVPVDWFNDPAAGATQQLATMFANAPALPNGIPAGITLHVDAGSGMDSLGNPFSQNMNGGPLEGGNEIGGGAMGDARPDVVYFGAFSSFPQIPGVQERSLDDIKNSYFRILDQDARELVFHYVVLADFHIFVPFSPNVYQAKAAAGSTASTLVSSVPFPVDPMDGHQTINVTGASAVMITQGTGAGQIRGIARTPGAPPNQLTIVGTWATIPDTTSTFVLLLGSSGVGEETISATDFSSIPGNDLVISLGTIGLAYGINADHTLAAGALTGSDNYILWRGLAHELGHNLGLRHGGNDDTNNKPNYPSLMNYAHTNTAGDPVSSYSATQNAGSVFNDWSNLQLDFQNYATNLGSSFALGPNGLTELDPAGDLPAFLLTQANTTTQLKISAPASITAGLPLTVTVTALSVNNTQVFTYLGTIHFTSSDTKAVLPANYTFTAADAGVHTFTITLKTAGSQTVTATDTVTASITGKATVGVSPAAASHFALAPSSSSPTAGVPFSLTLYALDPYGNVASSFLGTAHFTSTDPRATLPADYTFTAADKGKHTFTNGVTLVTAGVQSVTATAGTITGMVKVSVVAAAAAKFQLIASTSTPIAGTPFSITVSVLDAFGNVVGAYVGTVHFTSSDGAAVLPADYTFKSTDKGKHTFSVTLNTVGAQTVTVTDTAHAAVTGSVSVTVQPHGAAIVGGSGTIPDWPGLGTALLDSLYAADPHFPHGVLIGGR